MTAPVLTKEQAAAIALGRLPMTIQERAASMEALDAIASGQTRVIQAPSAELVSEAKFLLESEDYDYPPRVDKLIRDLLSLLGEKP